MPTLEGIAHLWDRVRTSLWFVPGLMALGAAGLAVLTVYVERIAPEATLSGWPLVFSGRPDGAREVLATVAASMITIAGVIFSMTVVSLQLASSQFGPRLLRTFLRDRGNQIVLGTFVGTFLYCVLAMPAVDAGESSFVPQLAVTVAVVLAVFSLGMLVYFIDHLAQSIHADAVIPAVTRELDEAIERLCPERADEREGGEGEAAGVEPREPEPAPEPTGAPATVASPCAGYVRMVNEGALVDLAVERDLVVRLETSPGRYVFEAEPLASAWPASAVDDDVASRIRSAVAFGAHRTMLQDVPFGFEQLAEMAVRALSPGINDPTTAIHCIDRVGSSMARLVERRLPEPHRRDERGDVRLIVEPLALDRLVSGSVEPIARNAGEHLAVWLRLLEVLEVVHRRAARPADRRLIAEHGRGLVAEAWRTFDRERDRARIVEASRWTPSG